MYHKLSCTVTPKPVTTGKGIAQCVRKMMILFVIEDANYTDEGVEIELKNLEDWMIGEDWYINLFRLSNYAKAS